MIDDLWHCHELIDYGRKWSIKSRDDKYDERAMRREGERRDGLDLT